MAPSSPPLLAAETHAAELRPPLRIALLESEGGCADWAAALAPGQPVEVERVASPADLAGRGSDLVVICAAPRALPLLPDSLASVALTVPVALLAGQPLGEHPLVRLMTALVTAKREWEAAFDALLEPIALLDREGKVVRANRGFADSLGLDIREVSGRDARGLLGPAETGSGGDPLAQSLEDGQPRSGEASYANLRGPHLVSVAPLPAGFAQGGGLVLLIKDLSEQKEQQQRLLQAARLADVGQLAAGLAHEINTPLASIALRAESLRRAAEHEDLRGRPAFSNFPRYLEAIEAEVFRCKKIIKALVDFATRQEPAKQLLDLNAVVRSACALVENQLRLHQIRFETRLADGLSALPADGAQVRQVLVALLMNAIDATPPGAGITVVTAAEGSHHLVLGVEDEGAGIPEELQDKIWSPFFSTKPLGQGAGLGLAIAHGIVAAHGGTIELESARGRGTRVSIRLPVTSEEVSP